MQTLAVMPMRFCFIFLTLLTGCSSSGDNPVDIHYTKGDFWVANFRNNSFPSKAFVGDKIYCSSLTSSDTTDYFYCLNLKTGRVDWVVPVKKWASQPPIICDSVIYYFSYVGDIYKFDMDGKQLWYSQFPSTYGGHRINPINNNLLVGTVAYGLREVDKNDGKVINSIGKGIMDVTFPLFLQDTSFIVIGDTLFAGRSLTSSNIWKRKTGPSVDRIFLKDKVLYYIDNSQRLYAVNAITGEMIWKTEPVFPMQPFSPHLEFERGMILCYFTDLNNIFIIDQLNGRIEGKKSYDELNKDNYLLPSINQYVVTSDTNEQYDIKVMNTLFGPDDFEDQFDVVVGERHYR